MNLVIISDWLHHTIYQKSIVKFKFDVSGIQQWQQHSTPLICTCGCPEVEMMDATCSGCD